MPSDNSQNLPPSADHKKAEKYISQFIDLINKDKLTVSHTDLAKFDPSALQDHYRIDFSDYSVEISHSKNPNSGTDSYIMLFTNVKQMQESQTNEKVILAYIHLDNNQFIRFKAAAHDQKEKIRKAEEEKRFAEAIAPIDQALERLEDNPTIKQHNSNIEYLTENSPKTEQLEDFTKSNGLDLTSFSSSYEDHDFPESISSTKPLTT